MTSRAQQEDRRRKGPEKQTSRLEVRLGPSLRQRFLDTCERVGDTPSDVIRAAMSDYILRIETAERKTLKQELTMRLIRNPLKTIGMTLSAAAAMLAFAVPVGTADTDPFKLLDENGDGVLSSADEAFKEALDPLLVTADTNKDGVLSKAEFDTLNVKSGTLGEDANLSGIDLSEFEGKKPKTFVMITSGDAADSLTDEDIAALIEDGDVSFSKEDGKKITIHKKTVTQKNEEL